MIKDMAKGIRKRTRPLPRGLRCVSPDIFRTLQFSPASFSVSGPSRKYRAAVFLLAATGSAILGWAFSLDKQLETTTAEKADIVVFTEEIALPEPPPPPPPPPMPPPPPRTPPPDPIQPPEPEIVAAEEPTPVFGIQEEALSEAGNMAVATGNTLMMQADSLVQAAPPPLPAAPLFSERPPRMLKGVSPEYPRRALNFGLEATVIALITIDNTGRVTQVEIEKSGGRDFDRNVEKAARRALFEPPVKEGKPMAATFRQPYEFKLEG